MMGQPYGPRSQYQYQAVGQPGTVPRGEWVKLVFNQITKLSYFRVSCSYLQTPKMTVDEIKATFHCQDEQDLPYSCDSHLSTNPPHSPGYVDHGQYMPQAQQPRPHRQVLQIPLPANVNPHRQNLPPGAGPMQRMPYNQVGGD